MDMKILIVDDNQPMRDLIRAVVADLAESVTECQDGEEAVAAYARAAFCSDDRVLMDLQMPRVGGLEATRRIRASFSDPQIIIVTQHDGPHWRAAAADAGACGYVLKDKLLDLRKSLSPLSPTSN
ncbi:MAG: response regulator [Acidobacteriota bacterium]